MIVSPNARSLSLACLLALAACAAPVGRLEPQAIGTQPGVAFQPPIGHVELLTGSFDLDVPLVIEIFRLSGNLALTPSVGPSFSTQDGSIAVTNTAAEEAYQALWHTRDSAQPDGARLRVEVRLPNAAPGLPACDAGTSLESGCLAFATVTLWPNRGAANKSSTEDGLDLVNGQALPIRLHITEGAADPPVQVEVDLEPPSVSIATPAPAATVSLGETVAITGSVTDESNINRVQAYAGPLLVGAAILTPHPNVPNLWTYSVAWTPLQAGPVTLLVVAYDGANNEGATTSQVTVADP